MQSSIAQAVLFPPLTLTPPTSLHSQSINPAALKKNFIGLITTDILGQTTVCNPKQKACLLGSYGVSVETLSCHH